MIKYECPHCQGHNPVKGAHLMISRNLTIHLYTAGKGCVLISSYGQVHPPPELAGPTPKHCMGATPWDARYAHRQMQIGLRGKEHSSRNATSTAALGVLRAVPCALVQIHIDFLPNLAPETVAAVHALASNSRECQGCKFYRNEAAPPKASLGPPYGLLQVCIPWPALCRLQYA